MKSSKGNRACGETISRRQEVFFDRESAPGEETTNNTSSERMLDNLKIALFFSQVQCQMSSKEQD